MQWVGIVPESGEVLMHYHHMFKRTDTTCQQIKMGMVTYKCTRVYTHLYLQIGCFDVRPPKDVKVVISE